MYLANKTKFYYQQERAPREFKEQSKLVISDYWKITSGQWQSGGWAVREEPTDTTIIREVTEARDTDDALGQQ